jgi:gas vesicle protein
MMWAASLLDGAMPALDTWSRWCSVDEHVFQAASHMCHEQIDSFADLLRVVHAKDYAVDSAGFFNKLLGHVGEWHVQEHLMRAGHAVAMPWATNEPSVDMWVDGHGVNVKTVSDCASAAQEHFAQHPDIAIVVPSDAANIPDDALYFNPAHGLDLSALADSDHTVIVDTALSHADVAGQVHDAVDVLQDPYPHPHVPWVTVAISAFREARLLVEGATELGRALKNVALDTAGVATGGALGMKIGASFGSLFGPLGTAIGASVGGIAGAILGRKVSNEIKRAPLKNAEQKYKDALGRYERTVQEAKEFAETSWQNAVQTEHKSLRQNLDRIQSEYDRIAGELRHRLEKAVFLSREQAERILTKVESDIDSVVEQTEACRRKKASGVLNVIAGIVAPQEYAEERAVKRGSKQWKREAKELLRSWPGPEEGTSKVFDLVLAAPGGERLALAHLQTVRDQRRVAYSGLRRAAENASAQAALARANSVARLRDIWYTIEAEVRDKLFRAADVVRCASDELLCELRKAGVRVE